jgi:hypothetical protein
MTVNQATGEVKTYPALYIWNQPSMVTETVSSCIAGKTFSGGPQNNLTPIWQDMVITPPPAPAAPTVPPP